MEGGFLFVTAAGQGARLAVLAAGDAELGLVTYEMALIVKRVGEHLSAQPRGAAPAPAWNGMAP